MDEGTQEKVAETDWEKWSADWEIWYKKNRDGILKTIATLDTLAELPPAQADQFK